MGKNNPPGFSGCQLARRMNAAAIRPAGVVRLFLRITVRGRRIEIIHVLVDRPAHIAVGRGLSLIHGHNAAAENCGNVKAGADEWAINQILREKDVFCIIS